MVESIDAFTPVFLTSILQSVTASRVLRVTDVYAEPLSLMTAHTAFLYRFKLSYADKCQDGPATVIAKLPRLEPSMAENARIFQPGTKEVWFYRQVAPLIKTRVPQLYFAQASRDTGKAVLLLEDLGYLEPVSQIDGVSTTDMRLALTEVANLHARWWGKTDTADLDELRSLKGDPEQSAMQVNDLFADAWPRFIQNARFAIPVEVMQLGNELAARGSPFGQMTLNAPDTVVHGDYRIDNLLFRQINDSRECLVLDWESVDIGSGLIDVSWLLGGCVPDLSADLEREFLQHYVDELGRSGVPDYPFATCYEDYRKCMVESFIQGILSGTLYEPEAASLQEIHFATTIGQRFVDAAMRLDLCSLI